MISAIKKLFAPSTEVDHTEALRTAGALLLLEVATADFNLGADEREVLKNSIGSRFGLAGAELNRLVEEAMRQHDVSVSLHEQITLLNAHYGLEQKRRLMRDLWTMAYADGELHHYEEAAIRRLADLLYVPHLDFIKTKHEVSGQP